MSNWRGQGGKRAKGRRGDQDPELDNTAWLAELEREAGQADDEEEDWANTLRGRRSPGPPPDEIPPAPAPPPSFSAGPAPPAPSQPAAEPSWMPPADPAPSPPDYRALGMEPDRPRPSSWDADPAGPTAASGLASPGDPPPEPEPDWSSWRLGDREGFGEPRPVEPPESERARPGESRPGGATDRDGFWDSERPGQAEPDWRMAPADPGQEAWRPAGTDTPTGAWSPVEPVGREPDYPALFGELYRRSAAQQDPIWEGPPPADGAGQPDPIWEGPPPADGAGQPDPPAASWPFEETTQTWEPSDRSFIWPADELPTTPTEWEPAASPSWMDDPPPPPVSEPGQTSAWSAAPVPGNGVPPPVAAPPTADWAAAIPTDVPAARRGSDPGAATRTWRPDQAVDVEPAVPLGTTGRPAATAPAPEPADLAEARRRPKSEGRRARQPEDVPSRSWPRIVAVISWIVLVMVVCWFYVFPWLERVLPESF